LSFYISKITFIKNYSNTPLGDFIKCDITSFDMELPKRITKRTIKMPLKAMAYKSATQECLMLILCRAKKMS